MIGGKLFAVPESFGNYCIYKRAEVQELFIEETTTNFVKPENENKVVELFVGVGGLEVGMEKICLKCVAFNEICKWTLYLT